MELSIPAAQSTRLFRQIEADKAAELKKNTRPARWTSLKLKEKGKQSIGLQAGERAGRQFPRANLPDQQFSWDWAKHLRFRRSSAI